MVILAIHLLAYAILFANYTDSSSYSMLNVYRNHHGILSSWLR